MRDRGLKSVETVVQRQECRSPKATQTAFFSGVSVDERISFGPIRASLEGRPLPPISDDLLVETETLSYSVTGARDRDIAARTAGWSGAAMQ